MRSSHFGSHHIRSPTISHHGGHERHPDEERVGEDADGQREADRLDDHVVAEGEAGEDADHDDGGRGDDACAVLEALEDDRPWPGAPWTYSSRMRETRNTS